GRPGRGRPAAGDPAGRGDEEAHRGRHGLLRGRRCLQGLSLTSAEARVGEVDEPADPDERRDDQGKTHARPELSARSMRVSGSTITPSYRLSSAAFGPTEPSAGEVAQPREFAFPPTSPDRAQRSPPRGAVRIVGSFRRASTTVAAAISARRRSGATTMAPTPSHQARLVSK